jgi:hypothetical protein
MSVCRGSARQTPTNIAGVCAHARSKISDPVKAWGRKAGRKTLGLQSLRQCWRELCAVVKKAKASGLSRHLCSRTWNGPPVSAAHDQVSLAVHGGNAMTRTDCTQSPSRCHLSPFLIPCIANVAAASQESSPIAGQEDLLTSLLVFGLVTIAAGAAAYSVKMIRRSQ